MRWVVKAALHKRLSALPRSEAVNYVLQRHATHTLPVGEPAFRREFRRALLHVGAYAEHGPGLPLGEAVFYEVGPRNHHEHEHAEHVPAEDLEPLIAE